MCLLHPWLGGPSTPPPISISPPQTSCGSHGKLGERMPWVHTIASLTPATFWITAALSLSYMIGITAFVACGAQAPPVEWHPPSVPWTSLAPRCLQPTHLNPPTPVPGSVIPQQRMNMGHPNLFAARAHSLPPTQLLSVRRLTFTYSALCEDSHSARNSFFQRIVRNLPVGLS